MRVPQFDLGAQFQELREEILAALDRVGAAADFVSGAEVAAFEEEFAAYCGARHCVAVNSGTSALHLGLLAMGVGPGDEVVTAPNTFTATAEAILYTSAQPVFADVDPATANLDPKSAEAAITGRTKAVVPVHLYGRPAATDGYALPVLEDACQAHGARVGPFAAYSFYPSKNLGAYGEGGALTTDDDEVAALARRLRNHGDGMAVGFNYRLGGFQAAVLRCKLPRLDGWIARRRELAAMYRDRLTGARLDLPTDDPDNPCAYHQFAVFVDDRDGVRRALDERGVGTGVHYPVPLHLLPAYAPLRYQRGDFPHAERACARTLSLPLYPELTDEQLEYVAAAVHEVVGRA